LKIHLVIMKLQLNQKTKGGKRMVEVMIVYN
jgi:hypothetical protein